MFHDDMTLGEARDLLRELIEPGHECPCCHQFAKVYRRKVTGHMATMLAKMYRKGRLDFVNLPSLRTGQGGLDDTIMQHFGLIEEEKRLREDGGRAGWWRVSGKGERYLTAAAEIPKYAHVYAGKRLYYSGPSVTIFDALGTDFNYRELMDG